MNMRKLKLMKHLTFTPTRHTKKRGIAVNKKSLFREMIYAVEGFWRSNCEEEEEKLSIKGNQENL